MNKYIKAVLLSLVIILFSSCGKVKNASEEKRNGSIDDIEYPTYTVSEYNEMDKYEYNKVIEGIKYKYTYFFKEDMCVNAKEELTFNTSDKAKSFYEENKESEDYMDISINSNKVIYYYNPEYFEYLMYPKDTLIELLNSIENSE